MELNLKPEAAVQTLIAESVGFAMNANQKMHEAAKLAAEKHQGVSAKVVQTIYAENIVAKDARVQSNARQQFAASLICFMNASIKVEVKAPTADKPAVFKDAKDLTASEAKVNAAVVRQAASEAAQRAEIESMNPEEKTKAIKEAFVAAEAAKGKQEAAKLEARKAQAKATVEAFAAQYGAAVEFGYLPLLDELLAKQGISVKFSKGKGKPDGFAAAVANLTK